MEDLAMSHPVVYEMHARQKMEALTAEGLRSQWLWREAPGREGFGSRLRGWLGRISPKLAEGKRPQPEFGPAGKTG